MTEAATITTADMAPGVGRTLPDVSPQVLHILHVEDNAADATLIQEYLRGVVVNLNIDCVPRLASVTAARVAWADCALVDLSLPDASGLEALVAMRSLSESLPIIVLTGFDNLELGVTALRFGADDYLIKNHVDGYTLERAVKYCIERRRLLLQLADAEVDRVVTTAQSHENDERASDWDTHITGSQEYTRTATGTHEVSVRIQPDTGEYALSCRSCGWVAQRGREELHSWSARSLDEVLLNHVDFNGRTHPSARETRMTRRRVFRPRSWFRSK